MARRAEEDSNVIKKPVRQNLRKVRAANLKCPTAFENETTGEPEREFTYVTANGRAVKAPCTEAAFARAGGKRFPNKRHSGLYRRKGINFFVAREKTGTQQVVGVDVFPEKLYHNGGAPTSLEGVEHITLRITLRTGEVTIEKVPEKTANFTDIQNIIKDIDAKSVIAPGDILGSGKFEVVSVAGNRVTLDLIGSDD